MTVTDDGTRAVHKLAVFLAYWPVSLYFLMKTKLVNNLVFIRLMYAVVASTHYR